MGHLRWQQTRKLLAYRESTHTILNVTCPYFMCNPHLSILFLNILTLLACTHSADNVFHTLMVLWENENFLTSNQQQLYLQIGVVMVGPTACFMRVIAVVICSFNAVLLHLLCNFVDGNGSRSG